MKFYQKYIISKGIKKCMHPRILELNILEQIFCRVMSFQNAYHRLPLKDNLKLCVKLKYKYLTAKSFQCPSSVPIYQESK